MKSCQLTQRSCKKRDLEKNTKQSNEATAGTESRATGGHRNSDRRPHLWPAFGDNYSPFSPPGQPDPPAKRLVSEGNNDQENPVPGQAAGGGGAVCFISSRTVAYLPFTPSQRVHCGWDFLLARDPFLITMCSASGSAETKIRKLLFTAGK